MLKKLKHSQIDSNYLWLICYNDTRYITSHNLKFESPFIVNSYYKFCNVDNTDTRFVLVELRLEKTSWCICDMSNRWVNGSARESFSKISCIILLWICLFSKDIIYLLQIYIYIHHCKVDWLIILYYNNTLLYRLHI